MSNWKAVGQLESKTIRVSEAGSAPLGFGLCDDCIGLEWTVTRYGSERVHCKRLEDYPIALSKVDHVIRCSSFSRRNQMSLDAMFDMATIINIRKPIGFSGGEVEIEIKPPTEEDDE